MPVSITRIIFKSLWNGEYVLLVNRIIKTMEDLDPTDLHFPNSFARLKAMKPELAKIKKQKKISPITAELRTLDERRDALFQSIVALVKSHLKVDTAADLEAAKTLDHLLGNHKRNVPKMGYMPESQRLIDLFAEYDAQPQCSQAAQKLNMSTYFEQLRQTNNTFGDKFLERNMQKSQTDKSNAVATRQKTDIMLTSLFDGIEFLSREHEDKDYSVLASRINELVAYDKAAIHGREGRRKKRKERKSRQSKQSTEQ